MTYKSFPETVIRRFLQILLTISLIIGGILLPFLLLPLAIYKLFVLLCAKLFGPKDMTHFLPATNSIFALERSTTRPKTNLVGFFILSGDLDVNKIRSTMEERVINKQKKSGVFAYPELRQIAHEFMGYFFWKFEKNFQLKEHIRLYDYEDDSCRIPKDACTEKDLRRAMGGLIAKPWKEDFSQWEILIIPNYQNKNQNGTSGAEEKGENTHVLCFRLHHCMGDGYGWLKLLVMDLAQVDYKSMEIPMPTMPKRNPFLMLLALFILPFKLPWDIAKDTVESYDSVNPWHTKSKRSRQFYTSISRPFPIQLVKDIKTKFGVSYMSVLSSACAGGIRRVMTEVGQKVPEKMAILTPIPLPGHPDSLDIHATMIHLTWPIAEADPAKRLAGVFHNMKKKVWMTSPLGLYWVAQVTSVCPTFMPRLLYSTNMSSISASNFPGPVNPPEFLKCKVLDIIVGCGLGPGQAGAFFSMVSVCGNQRFVITIDKSLFPSQEIFWKLGDYIAQELEELNNVKVEKLNADIV